MRQRSFWSGRLLALPLLIIVNTFFFIGASGSAFAARSAPTTTPTPRPSMVITSVTQPGSACLTIQGPIVITVQTIGFSTSGISFYLDNVQTYLGSTSETAPYTFTWTSHIPDGVHNLFAEVMYGAAERVYASTSITIFVGCTPTPPPTLTPPVTPTPSVTPTVTPIRCTIGYTITSQWTGGFGALIAITNTGTAPIAAWTLQFVFPNGQTISQGWNGSFTQSGATVSITNLSYNGTLAPGASLSSAPGFNGAWSGANQAPTSFFLNGVACQGS